MHRFYLPSFQAEKGLIEITDSRLLHQLNKVLRMKMGKKFTLFNEHQGEFSVEIIEINKRKVLLNQLDSIQRNTDADLSVHLYQSIPKKPALFELVIQKATELGVSHIYPLITERTEKKRLLKFERMQMIAIEAAEQCGRIKVPVIHHPVNYEEILSETPHAYIGFEYEEERYLSDYFDEIQKQDQVHLFIGPEGGFSQSEIDFALKSQARPFSLGKRILRTETAAIASLSLLMCRP